ncbi:MAG: outer membrane lipoprotein-sorting protein [Chthoniobacterales bacterium]|nr:outer membrane lipoprotein-sorting protein [Chthoniobacterales bacterium]
MNFFFSFFCPSLFFLFLLAFRCESASELPAQDLLKAARLHPTAHPLQLSGELRGREQPLPFTLTIEKGALRYQFYDPEETILLTMGPVSSSLSASTKGTASHLLTEAKRYQEIRDTGVTYDDLSLGFLYWPQPHLLKHELLRGMKVAVIELCAPSSRDISKSPYGSARVWVDANNGMPLRMEGFDPRGHLLKRFEVISAQKIEDLWMLKEMRIETFDPATEKILQRRYLDFSAQ